MNYLFPIVLVLSGCASYQALPPQSAPAVSAPPTTAVLGGTVAQAAPGDTLRLYYARPGQPQRTEVKVPLSADGSFTYRLTGLTAPLPVQLAAPRGVLALYLTPGDSLQLSMERARLFETLRFTGRGAAVNTYLARAQGQFDYNFDGQPERQHATATPAQFVQRTDAYRQQQLDTLAAWHARYAFPQSFLQARRQVLDLQRGVSLLRYVAELKSRLKQEPELPAGYFDFLKTLDLPAEGVWACRADLLQSLAFFIGAYQNARLLPPSGKLTTEAGTTERLYARATADIGENTLRDQVIGWLLAGQLYDFTSTSREPVRAVLPTFFARTRDSAAVQQVRFAWRTTAGLQVGSMAPTFRLRDAGGKPVALQDFRGKVVYLDFWYSSCAPCLAEAPAATKLKKQFLGRDVVFLYISVDRKAADWQQALAKYPLTGPNSVHLLDPGATQAAAAYAVGGYPSYWIIGRDGRIWRNGAPRPSAGPETVAVLEQALAQKP